MQLRFLKYKNSFYKTLIVLMGIIGIISLNACVFRGHKTKYGGPPAEYSDNLKTVNEGVNEK